MKNEKGFSLVELAVAAVLAVALGAVTVSILSGTAGTMSGNASTAKDGMDCYNSGVIASKGEVADCGNGGGGNGGNGGGAQIHGINVYYDGTLLTYSVDASRCNQSNLNVSYYYNDAGGGTRLMGTNASGSYNPSVSGYPLNGNLGFGNYIQSYFVGVNCDGTQVMSDNVAP